MGLDIKLNNTASLKEKRNIIKSILEKSKRRFNIAIIESDYQDDTGFAYLSITSISNNKVHIENQFRDLVEFIELNYDVEIIEIDIESR